MPPVLRPLLGFPLLFLAALPGTTQAGPADAAPEIQRPTLEPQRDGAPFILRVIPEACARLEGTFTGDPARPFSMRAQPTRSGCQPRAQLVDAASARPSAKTGWILNDRIRVPSARCPTQMAVVEIWRDGKSNTVPSRDAQGRVRIYLHDALSAGSRGQTPALPRFATRLTMQGAACR